MGSSGGVAPRSIGGVGDDKRPRRTREERKQRAANRRSPSSINTIVFNPFFVLLLGLAGISCLISFFLVLSHPESHQSGQQVERQVIGGGANANANANANARNQQHKLEAVNGGGGGGAGALDDDTGDDTVEDPQADEEGQADDDDDNHIDGVAEAKANANANAKAKAKVEVKKLKKKDSKHQRMANHEPKLNKIYTDIKPFDTSLPTPHLIPKVPPLPIFNEVPNGEALINDLLHNNKPTVAGIIAFFDRYLQNLHNMNKKNSETQHRDVTGNNIDEMSLINSYFDLTMKEMELLESAYRGRTIFPVRDDDSLYISLAAFREHLLGKSMMSAFDQAKDPSKLFFGAVVQNCFGLDGTVCKTGLVVVGKDKNGHDRTSVSPKPPDENGIEEFCTHKKYKKYCDNGQVRVLYVHDTDALGPQTARFYASKLWAGETFFMQMDAHLEFAPNWDQYYIDEARATKNYPKSVLSAYPPGFQQYNGQYMGGTAGARLCSATFSQNSVEHHILRINVDGNTPTGQNRPTQIPFIAAGFFFAHADFLTAVPFDPYAPWCFMGEEIALSLRAWTNGWNIYAPRLNMIAHQYRPGRLGLPKFWESVGRDSGRASLNTRLQKHVLRRVKYMLGYPTDSEEAIAKDGDSVALSLFEHYSLGHERTLEDYLEWTNIDSIHEKTARMGWCVHSELE